jgi:hypothetical protein
MSKATARTHDRRCVTCGEVYLTSNVDRRYYQDTEGRIRRTDRHCLRHAQDAGKVVQVVPAALYHAEEAKE